MAIKSYKPTSAGTRFRKSSTNAEVTKNAKSEKSLVVSKNRTGGRNNIGRITVRHIGGGDRIKYRVIDFKRNKDGISAKVSQIEYDPNRTAYIALLNYVDGEKRYILAPLGLQVGDEVKSGSDAEVRIGNNLPLENMPVGTIVHNIEFIPNRGGKIARSAGVSAQLMAKEGKYATLRMPSGEMRKVLLVCRATIGQVGNLDHELVKFGKAGRVRHMGTRPTVRGVVMNPVDHPHGGGEGKSPVGYAAPRTPWGKPALGFKTRKTKKSSEKLMVKRAN